MPKQKYFFLILGAILIILNCNKKSTDPEIKPPMVIFVPSSDPLNEEERGIDAIPEGDGIFIEWYGSTDEFVDRYDIYRSDDEEKNYILLDRIDVPDTSYIDEVPKMKARYYYYIQAVNIDDIKSELSDTVNYQLLAKAEIISPRLDDVSDTKPLFQWRDPNEEHLYVIRLREALSGEYIWISSDSSNYGAIQDIKFNSKGDAKADALIKGREYEWRVDVIGGQRANTGSESAWVAFTIN